MSEYKSHLNWIGTIIKVFYRDGSERLIAVKPGDNLADATGDGWNSLMIIGPFGRAYSHDNKPNPEISPEREEMSEAGSREGATVPG